MNKFADLKHLLPHFLWTNIHEYLLLADILKLELTNKRVDESRVMNLIKQYSNRIHRMKPFVFIKTNRLSLHNDSNLNDIIEPWRNTTNKIHIIVGTNNVHTVRPWYKMNLSIDGLDKYKTIIHFGDCQMICHSIEIHNTVFSFSNINMMCERLIIDNCKIHNSIDSQHTVISNSIIVDNPYLQFGTTYSIWSNYVVYRNVSLKIVNTLIQNSGFELTCATGYVKFRVIKNGLGLLVDSAEVGNEYGSLATQVTVRFADRFESNKLMGEYSVHSFPLANQEYIEPTKHVVKQTNRQMEKHTSELSYDVYSAYKIDDLEFRIDII